MTITMMKRLNSSIPATIDPAMILVGMTKLVLFSSRLEYKTVQVKWI